MYDLTYLAYLRCKNYGWSDQKIAKEYQIDMEDLEFFIKKHYEIYSENGFFLRID